MVVNHQLTPCSRTDPAGNGGDLDGGVLLGSLAYGPGVIFELVLCFDTTPRLAGGRRAEVRHQ